VNKINRQTHKGKREHGPHRAKQNLASKAALVPIGKHIADPRRHCKEHKQKIQLAVQKQKRKDRFKLTALVQKAPQNVRDKVTVCGREKMPVAANRPTLVLPLSYDFKRLSVYYEIDY
jgi:hypothetical protein